MIIIKFGLQFMAGALCIFLLSCSPATSPNPTGSGPGIPIGVMATAGDSHVMVAWTAVNEATSYNLYFTEGATVSKLIGARITGATSPFDLTGLTNGTRYAFAVSAVNSAGESDLSAAQTATPIAACTVPSITTHPTLQSVTAPAVATFSIAASGTSLTYQWQRAGSIAPLTFINVTTGIGATTASYTTAATTVAADSGAMYRCVVTNGCCSVASDTAALTVMAPCVAPTITTQPTAQIVTTPATATFSIVASSTSPTYQWQRAEAATPTAFVNVVAGTGGTTASFTTTSVTVAADNGAVYRCVVTGSCGSVTSSAVALTVKTACIAPKITTQPTAQSVLAPAAAIFALDATGTSLTYQWQRAEAVTPTTFANVTSGTGGTTAAFTTAATTVAADSGAVYRCVVTGSCGGVMSSAMTLTVVAATVSDTDGNAYHAVKIGSQIWMVENLKTTKYNDGTAIPLVTDSAAWSNLRTPGYCWYNNDSSTVANSYGALYNWYVVNTGKLAPKGWHVPSDSEWTVLENCVGGSSVAGGPLKSTSPLWMSPNAAASNARGFSALPSGFRVYSGTCTDRGVCGIWWSSTAYDAISAWNRGMDYNYPYVDRNFNYFMYGFSVRCLRD